MDDVIKIEKWTDPYLEVFDQYYVSRPRKEILTEYLLSDGTWSDCGTRVTWNDGVNGAFKNLSEVGQALINSEKEKSV